MPWWMKAAKQFWNRPRRVSARLSRAARDERVAVPPPGAAMPGQPKAERLEAVLAGMTDGVMMLDRQLRLVEWNAKFSDFTGIPAAMLCVGLSMEQMLRAQAAAGEFGELDPDQEVARRMALLQTGGAIGTIERVRPNGQVLELRRNPIPGGGFVTLYTDVTARRQAEERLRQAQKMETVGHLTGSVAHDFNNLLMIILGNLDAADRAAEAEDRAKLRSRIDLARGGARRAASLTQRLLAFSRKQPSEPQPVDVSALVANMAELIRQSATSRVTVGLALAERPWMTLVDPNQLEIAILNLVINARDAMRTGGEIVIGTANLVSASTPLQTPNGSGEFVRVTVQDTGPGMSRSVAERACEPFFTTKPAGQGTGLGLYQVADFTSQAGGQVSIESQIGVGTTVSISLPRFIPPEPEPEPDAASAGEADRWAGKGETIVVVENEPDILAYATESLAVLGYNVVGAQDASAALTLLERHPTASMLFTDLGLPGIDGAQLASEAARRWPALAILTASGGPVPSGMGDRPGTGRGVIHKPYDAAALARKVRSVIDNNTRSRAVTPPPL